MAGAKTAFRIQLLHIEGPTRDAVCKDAVHAGDACFEVFSIDEGPVGEVMTLQLAPGEFDVVESGALGKENWRRAGG